MKRIVTLVSLLLLALSLAVPAGPADAAPRGRVTVALGSDTPTQDPHMHTARMGIIINQHIFDTLLARDTTTWKPVPHLAESVKSVNALTWELRLRKGVTFHNGEPFTAESVKFSFDRVLNPEQKSPLRGNFTWIKSVDVVDEHTVRIVTTKPYPLIQEILTFGNFGMVPPRYIKEKGDANFAKHPVGTGPFTFVEWRKGERTVLEANERYWKGAPAIKTLVFRVIPETATQIAELLSGGVDIIRAVPPDQIPAIERSGTARITATKILRVVYLQLDGDGRAGKTPLTDVRVRRAINHAVNVDEIMQKVLGGKAVRAATGDNPMVFGYDPAVKPYAYDPAQARKLLAEAGYPNGLALTRHTYAIYYIHFHAGEPYAYNTSREMDQWLEAGRSTVDPRQRQDVYSRFQRFIVDQAYWVRMCAQFTIEAGSNKLNYEASSDEIMRVHAATWK